MTNKHTPIPGFSNPRCYARALTGCCRQMSGEHFLSKAILKRVNEEFTESPGVEVRNMGFQPPDTAQNFGVGSLESRILCTYHNNRLSPLDAEALKVFEAFEAMHYAAAEGRWASESVYAVDGDLFERWMLKAVCGGLFSGNMRTDGSPELKGVEPPLDWLEIIYEGKRFPDRFGLYSVAPQGSETFTIDQAIYRCSPMVLRNEFGTFVHGALLHLFGFRFALLASGGQPRAVEAMAGQSYRPNGCVLDGSGTRVNFAWVTGPGSAEVAMRLI